MSEDTRDTKRDEIAEALQELRDEIVKATGELPANVDQMIGEELEWIRVTRFQDDSCLGTEPYAIAFAEEDCRKWWLEPAQPVTPEQLATVRRSRLYFQALEKPNEIERRKSRRRIFNDHSACYLGPLRRSAQDRRKKEE